MTIRYVFNLYNTVICNAGNSYKSFIVCRHNNSDNDQRQVVEISVLDILSIKLKYYYHKGMQL